MNRFYGMVTSFSLIVGGLMCSAQELTIPFRQIEHDAILSASLKPLGNDAEMNTPVNGAYPVSPSAPVVVNFQPSYERPRVIDTKFLLLNGLHMGLAALDYGLTQHCLANHHCREGNPLMPSSAAGQAAVGSAWVGSGFLISYHLKKQDSNVWWLSPLAGIGAHAAGAITGFIHR